MKAQNTKKMQSDFGKGLTYCLGLFLCHSERDYGKKDKDTSIIYKPGLWFYAAADHLFDLQIPDTLPTSLQNRLKTFQSKILHWRLVMDKEKQPIEKDKIWAIQEAKDLLRLIDKYYGVKAIKGEWE